MSLPRALAAAALTLALAASAAHASKLTEIKATHDLNVANRKALAKKLVSALEKAPSKRLRQACVVVGAGVAGTVAAMFDSRCLVIDGRATQGIHQGLGEMLQKWADVTFPVPAGRPVTQPVEFKTGAGPLVTLAALEAARSRNERDFKLNIVHGRVSGIQMGKGGAVSLNVALADPKKVIPIDAGYVVLVPGAGATPNPMRPEQYGKNPALLKQLKTTAHGGVPLVLADTELMGGFKDKAVPKADHWVMSGTNAGAASVAAFLLEKGVPPANIVFIGPKTGRGSLDEVKTFGGSPGEAYYNLFQDVKAGTIHFAGGRLASVKLAPGGAALEVATDTAPISAPAPLHHLVTAFNMQSELPKLFGATTYKQIKAKQWLKAGKLVGLRVVQGDKELPIAILGAATTTLPKELQHATHATFISTMGTELTAKPSAFTPAAVPYHMPKVAEAVKSLVAERH